MNTIEQLPAVQRFVRWYEKSCCDFVGETVLNNIQISQLQKLFEIASDNPMYDCYLVSSPEQINYLQRILNCQFNIHDYEYFLECDAI